MLVALTACGLPGKGPIPLLLGAAAVALLTWLALQPTIYKHITGDAALLSA